MAAVPPPPPGLDIHESRQSSLWAAEIVTFVLATISLGLRFWARSLLKNHFGLDDWIMFSAWIVSIGLFASTAVWIHQGYGLHLWVLTPEFVPNFFKNLFVGEILYTLIICLVKFSILAFYWRLFSAARQIRIPIIILSVIVASWGIAVILTSIFQCIPVNAFWDREITTAKCIVNEHAFFIGISVPNIITDVALIVLPVPFIWQLHRSTSQKIALLGVFLLGSFVTIISLVRLVTLINEDATSLDLDWNFAQVGIWTTTEANIAIVSGCLPSLRPILSLVLTGSPESHAPSNYNNSKASGSWARLFKKSGGYSTNASRSGVSARSGPNNSYAEKSHGGFSQLQDDDQALVKSSAVANVHGDSSRASPTQDYELQSMGRPQQQGTWINVRRDVDVEYNRR